MNPYDTEAVKKVWARVQATQEDRLAAMIADERHDHQLYLRLARQFPRYRNLFQSIANDERRHAKRLTELYISLYHRRPTPAVEQVQSFANLDAALYARCEAERLGSQKYQQAVSVFPQQTAFFLGLAADEARHADRLCALTKRR